MVRAVARERSHTGGTGGVRPGEDERFEADSRAAATAPEHVVRYAWAAGAASGAVVLDAGCGSGEGTARLAAGARRAVGVDIAAPTVATARERHGALAEFCEADLRALPFGEDEFDLVACFETLEQVRDTDRALDELRRVLRPAGALLVSCANRDEYPAGNPLHLSELSPAELEAALRDRFAHVAMYGQRTHFASVLVPLPANGRREQIAEADVSGAATAGSGLDGALYAVAAAANGEPPAPPAAVVAVGAPVDHRGLRRSIDRWRDRAIEAEATLGAARAENKL